MGTLQLIGWQGEKTREVAYIPTYSEHFVVTPYVAIDGFWVVTHKKSTAKAAGPFATPSEASLVAAIFGALDMPWDSFTSMVSQQNGSPEMKKTFQDAWRKQPEEIKAWLKASH